MAWWSVLAMRALSVLLLLVPAAIGVRWFRFFLRSNVKSYFGISRKTSTTPAWASPNVCLRRLLPSHEQAGSNPKVRLADNSRRNYFRISVVECNGDITSTVLIEALPAPRLSLTGWR